MLDELMISTVPAAKSSAQLIPVIRYLGGEFNGYHCEHRATVETINNAVCKATKNLSQPFNGVVRIPTTFISFPKQGGVNFYLTGSLENVCRHSFALRNEPGFSYLAGGIVTALPSVAQQFKETFEPDILEYSGKMITSNGTAPYFDEKMSRLMHDPLIEHTDHWVYLMQHRSAQGTTVPVVLCSNEYFYNKFKNNVLHS